MGKYSGRTVLGQARATMPCSKITKALCALAILLFMTLPASAQMQPSSAQLQYFQSLSASEQQKLAEQFGVSLPGGMGSGSSLGGSQQSQRLPQTIYRADDTSVLDGEPISDRELKQILRGEQTDDELPIFGMNVFAGRTTSFTPIGDLPVPADYIVAPGDEINIQVYGKLNEQYNLVVSRDGKINIPNLGPFSVVGKRFSQVRDELHEKFQQQVIGGQISVSLGELHTMQVYILGDARKPGAYQLSSLATATQAIVAAGGIADTGSLRQLEVRRGSELIARIDLYDLLLNGSRGGDLRLQSGDAVFVPPAGARVKVDGEVLRPAIYELADKSATVGTVLGYAGGPLPSANTSRLRVERPGNTGLDVFTLNLANPSDRQFLLKEGDRLFLDKQNEGYRNSVQLSGSFINTGQHGFQEGMRVRDILANPKTVLRDDADASVALLIRQEPHQRISVRYVRLPEVLHNPQSPDNYLLQPEDQLLVLPAFTTQDPSELPYGNRMGQDPNGASTVRELDLQRRFSTQTATDPFQNRGVGSNQFSRGSMIDFDGKETHLLSIIQFDDGNLSAEEARAKKEAMRELSTLRVQRRRAELLMPIIDKLREQAGSESYQKVVEIAGEVKYPGSYPFEPGMSLETLLQIAGGLQENAFTEAGELARQVEEDGRLVLKTSRVPLDIAAQELMLRPRDKVNIFERPEWRNTVAVEVTGEVRFPGTYTVTRGTGFTELIERAGGLTEFAFPQGAVFSRESLKEKEQEQIQRLRDRLKEEVATLSLRKSSGISGLSVSPSEAIEAVDKLSSVEAMGRLVIDLPSLLESEKSKVTLEDGDFLHIPSHSRTVTVVGEVQYPSSHLYERGVSYKEYLERAGGPRQRADESRIYIIRANGQVELAKNSWFGTEVKEGDTIVVPINAQYVDKLSVFGSVTQILYQLGIAYDVISN